MVPRDESFPSSPTRPKTPASMAATLAQVRQFFDDWHCRFASSPLAKTWNRAKVVKSALDLLAINGAQLTPDDISEMCLMEEETMIQALVQALPSDVKEKFESVAQQLLVLVNSAILIRRATEAPDKQDVIPATIQEVENDAVTQEVLKRSVVSASQEVANLLRCQSSWVTSMDSRLKRLMGAAEKAEGAQRALASIESQLERFHGSTKSKSKKMLMNFASQDTQTILHASFSGWHAEFIKGRAEKGIRQRFENEIELAERQLMEYKMAKMQTARNILNRNSKAEELGLLGMVVESWRQAAADERAGRDKAAEEQALAAKLSAFTQGQMEKAKQVLTRMSGDQDEAVKSLAMQAWLKYSEECKEDKGSEEALKKVEADMAELMKKNKDTATSVMNRLNAATDSGVVELAWQGWTAVMAEAKAEAEVRKAMEGSYSKFQSLKLKQSLSAKKAQTRVNDQMAALLLTRVLCGWQIETRQAYVDKYMAGKVDSKRKQLRSVHELFKSFAMQIDQGIGKLEDEKEAMSTRKHSRQSHHSHHASNRHSRRSKSGLSKSAGQTSLPDIHRHQRAVVA